MVWKQWQNKKIYQGAFINQDWKNDEPKTSGKSNYTSGISLFGWLRPNPEITVWFVNEGRSQFKKDFNSFSQARLYVKKLMREYPNG